MSVKVAITALAIVMLTVQVVDVPIHPPFPLQPVNVDPDAAVAVSVTDVPDV